MNTAVNKLARKITRQSSRQTYLTISLLVNRSLAPECYKAYAYFRWLDDQIDTGNKSLAERLNFIERQHQIINDSFQGIPVTDSTPEENLIISLIQSNPAPDTKLTTFIHSFFAVIEFDAKRKGN